MALFWLPATVLHVEKWKKVPLSLSLWRFVSI